MEYYSFIFAFLSIIVTLLIAIWGTYSLKRSRKGIRYRMLIVFCILSFLFIICSLHYFKQLKENREKEINLLTEKYNTFFNTENYLDAVKTLDNLTVLVGKSEDKLYVINYNRATCYILLGFSESKKEYLEKAIDILNLLRSKNTKYSKKYDNTIRILLGEMFLYLDEPVYEPELEGIVYELEDVEKNSGCQDELVLYFLGSYYYKKFEETASNEYLLKAKEFFNEGTKYDFLEINNSEEYFLFQYMLGNVAFCYYKISISISEFGNDEAVINLEQAIDIYNYLLNDVDPNKNIYNYLEYKKCIGRCLITLGEFEKNDEYIYQGTEMLKYVIRFADEKFDSVIVGSGYFYFLYGMYEQEDIDMLFNKYNRLLTKYNIEDNITEIVEVYKDMAMSYYYIAKWNKDNNYYDKGIEIVELLYRQYYPIVNELNKDAIDLLKKNYSKLY